jgi:hypothetical protein
MRYLFVLHVHARNVDVFATRHKFLGILREVLQNDITILKVLHAHTKYYVWCISIAMVRHQRIFHFRGSDGEASRFSSSNRLTTSIGISI